MRRSFPDAFLSITGVLYLGLMTGLLVCLASLPAVVLLIATNPARTWPLLALTAPLAGPALSAAFGVFSSYGEDGSVTVVRTFVGTWRRTFGRALVLAGLASGLITVLVLDIAFLWGHRVGAVAIPPLVMAACGAVVAAVTSLVIAQDRPRARLRQVLAVAVFATVRRWHLSAMSLVALLILAAAVVKAPAIGLGLALGPILYLLWANARHSFAAVVRASALTADAQEGARAS